MRKAIILVLIFLVLLIAPFVVRYTRFYRLSAAERAPVPVYEPADIQPVPTPGSTVFVDEPSVGEGLVLLDEAHRNNFQLDDISYLDGRLAARGFELLHYTGGDLARQLRPVSAFVTIAPLESFSQEEIQAVRRFVDRGGRLLMVGDPTRFEVVVDESDPFAFTFQLDTDKIPLNSLANEFDLIFNGDYLYNTVENEGNFRNIVLKQDGMSDNFLLDDVSELAFYSAHSLQVGPTAVSLITADDNTWSSATDRPGGLVVAATGQDGRVLALGDIHFLNDPYFTVYDNSRFIAHIADFLSESSERQLTLGDFPYFFQQPVNLVFTGNPDLGAGAFNDIIALQDAFQKADIPLALAAEAQPNHDVLYLGLYNQSDDVADILASSGISLTIQPPIMTAVEEQDAEATPTPDPADENGAAEETAVRLVQSELGNVQMAGTALIVLAEEDGRRSVVVLAASAEGLQNTVSRLLDLIPLDVQTALESCLLQDPIALCPTNVADEPVEAELLTAQISAPTTPGGETPAGGGGGGGGQPVADLGAEVQGPIALGETVEGTLEAGVSHAWVFSDGPAVIDITVTADEDLDATVELYDPDNVLLDQQDAAFAGETEELRGIDIPDDGDYTIVVRDFFDDGGSYTLAVAEGELSEASPPSGEGIFLFVQDDGDPLNGGVSSGDALLALLQPQFEVTAWTTSVDGTLQEGDLDGYALVVWDTGDYQIQDGFFDDNTAVILNYLDSGGSLLVTGSAPPLFGDLPLTPITDVEVSGDDPILIDGFTSGDVFSLDQSYDAILPDLVGGTFDEASTAFFLRGPDSDTPGAVAGFAVYDQEFDQRTVFIMFPFVSLPEDVQATLLNNIVTWFGLSS
ncbi:MAG: hypothetical protein H6659_00180 [Ardenticatenaceae bacterium]|nr:hypothetical protein [Ardenticatenaceae bacterium]MCB8987013.1 hypothetical protein [Ardenticatenaceae bacterium]